MASHTHAAVQLQAGALQPAGVRFGSDAYHHDVGWKVASARQPHSGDVSFAAVEVLYGRGRDELHSVGRMEPAHHSTHFRSELRGKRHGTGVDHGDLHPARGRRGGYLGADEARADHNHPASGNQFGGKALRVREGAQREHVAQSGQGGQLPSLRACGNEDAIRLHGAAILKDDGPRGSIQGCGAGAQQPFCLQVVGVGLQGRGLRR